MSDNRRRRLLLEPEIQIKLGVYSMLLSVAFAASLLFVLRSQWLRFEGFLKLTQAVKQEWIAYEMERMVGDSVLWILLLLVVFLITNTCVAILLTHRLIGPTVAFRRHLRRLIDGDYTAMTALRPGDAFVDVAHDLNELSAALAARRGEGGAKADEPKADEPKAGEPKADEPKADEPKADEPEADEPEADEPEADEPEADDAKTDDAKTDDAKTDDAKTDDAKTDDAKTDDATAKAD